MSLAGGRGISERDRIHDANHWIMKGAEAKYFWEEVHAWLAKYLLD
ncbi:MAG: hypothetical protein GWM87_14160 [Xanthomonadales bacterium]|nr:hypothetical protein [Xanthomonadales bacterium]NIX13956.1 hypothetical protein [Xanthomonadales bacterium]